ncbi:MAG: MBL fold metallo-hydrolase [Leptospiraceae bacterium]|nr:MBL fold metallo-hydrolase [Leptospiraceae bacterium]
MNKILPICGMAVSGILALSACISINDPDRIAARTIGNEYQNGTKQILSVNTLTEQTAEAREWSDMLTQNARLHEFRVLHTGSVRVPREGVLHLEDPAAQDLPEDDLFVDVFAFWFCHSSAGCFLIDSGLDESYRTGQGGNVRGLMAKNYIMDTRQEPGQDIVAQLDRLVDERHPLKGVFFTHLHGDHTSGVPAITSRPEYRDLRWFAGRDENYVNYFLLYYGDHLANVRTLEEIDWTAAPIMSPLGNCVDIFGDGTFWAIATPGHSSGHLSYLLMTDDGPVLLTGDASHTGIGFERGIEPGWVWNRDLARSSLRQLRAFKRKFPNVSVIYGHERAASDG